MKLNLGCGRNILEGWVNVDREPLPKDVLLPLGTEYMPINLEKSPQLGNASVDEFAASHVLEHIVNLLPLMRAAWVAAKPGALFTARVPYGSSDDADEDPTHVRRFFLNSWGYFSQPYYWRADYGYRGDWQPKEVKLLLQPGLDPADYTEAFQWVRERRNVVAEMVCTLEAVKPARAPERELQQAPRLTIQAQP